MSLRLAQLFIRILLFVLLCLPGRQIIFAANAGEKQESIAHRIKSIFKKDQKGSKIESGPGILSAKQMKRFCENKIETLNAKIKKLSSRVEDSRIVYEQRKQEAWQLFIEQSRMERSNERDADIILDLHEKLRAARAVEAEALEEHRKFARQSLKAQEEIEECRREIEKADRMLAFTEQTVQ